MTCFFYKIGHYNLIDFSRSFLKTFNRFYYVFGFFLGINAYCIVKHQTKQDWDHIHIQSFCQDSSLKSNII